MNIEKDLFFDLDKNEIINIMMRSSDKLTRIGRIIELGRKIVKTSFQLFFVFTPRNFAIDITLLLKFFPIIFLSQGLKSGELGGHELSCLKEITWPAEYH